MAAHTHARTHVQNKYIESAAYIAFGQGDALGGGLDHCSVSINGSAFNLANMDRWWSSFVRLSLSSDFVQERYGMCGGLYDQFDCRGSLVSTERVAAGAGVGHRGFGLSIDSGVSRRARNLYDATTQLNIQGDANAGQTRRIRVRWPVAGGVFNPWFGAELNRINPYRNAALGLANINAVQVDLLFKERFAQQFIRKLYKDRPTALHGQTVGNVGVALNTPLGVSLVADSAIREFKY